MRFIVQAWLSIVVFSLSASQGRTDEPCAQALQYRQVLSRHFGRLAVPGTAMKWEAFERAFLKTVRGFAMPSVPWYSRRSGWVLKPRHEIPQAQRYAVDELLYALEKDPSLLLEFVKEYPTGYLNLVALKLEHSGEPYRVHVNRLGELEIEIGDQRPDLPLSGLARSVAADQLRVVFGAPAPSKLEDGYTTYVVAGFYMNLFKEGQTLYSPLDALMLTPFVNSSIHHELEHFRSYKAWMGNEDEAFDFCWLQLFEGSWEFLGLQKEDLALDAYGALTGCSEPSAYLAGLKTQWKELQALTGQAQEQAKKGFGTRLHQALLQTVKINNAVLILTSGKSPIAWRWTRENNPYWFSKAKLDSLVLYSKAGDSVFGFRYYAKNKSRMTEEEWKTAIGSRLIDLRESVSRTLAELSELAERHYRFSRSP